MGVGVKGIDLSCSLMQGVDIEFGDISSGWWCDGPGTLILHVNAPLVPLALHTLGRVARGKYVVAYWAWELPAVPDAWRHGVPFVHEIWVPSRFVADAVRPIAAGRPVRVLPHPVGLGPKPLVRRHHDPAKFHVLTIFNVASGFSRKNPLAAVQAFQIAFASDDTCSLTIKLSNSDTYPEAERVLRQAVGGDPRISIVGEVIAPAAMSELYRTADAYVSLHRAEGFGLTIAEAMLHGLPVVATDWSGNTDFMHDANGIPIAFTLVPASDPQGTYDFGAMTWADPNIALAARALSVLRTNQSLRHRLGDAAAISARQCFSPERYVETILGHLAIKLK